MTTEGHWVFTGPAFGFLTMSVSMWEQFAAEECEVYFCWDAGYEHRLELYPEYKANRREKKARDPEDDEDRAPISSMEEAIRKMLRLGGYRQAIAPGYEADDVLATLGARFGSQGRVALYTLDQDLHQSVTDSVHMVAGRDKIWTPTEVEEKWGLPPDRVAEIKGLIGDGGDNIPGCPGCGMSWAKKLFSEYGDVRSIIAASKDGAKPLLQGEYRGKRWRTPSLTTKIAANAETIMLSWELAKVIEDCPIDLERRQPDIKGFQEVLHQLRFDSLLEEPKWGTLERLRG